MAKEKFIVEKGVPLISKKKGGGYRLKYPFDKMEIGDSFLVPKSGKKPSTVAQGLYISVKKFNTYYQKSIKISARITDEGFRVWRVS